MNTPAAKAALVIFAREPRDGRVKTRLLKTLSAKKVTPLYKAFLRDVLAVASGVSCDAKFIFYAGPSSEISFLKRFRKKFILKPQRGPDLGERMLNAVSSCRKNGFEKIVIIGTDCLTLNEKVIARAFDELDHVDVVLGPCVDGGYYLIGLKKSYKMLFRHRDWGTPSVLAETLNQAAEAGLRTVLLKKMEDIDDYSSLKRFSQKNGYGLAAFYTKKILTKIFRHP